MDLTENPAKTNVPDAQWQFLLLPCLCGADEAEYKSAVEGRYNGPTTYWVRCCACGRETMPHSCAHDAQVEWNSIYRAFQKQRNFHE